MNKDAFVKRGLNDLLKENEILDLEKEEVIDIPLDKIEPNPFQPRKHFDSNQLNELAESIRINGVLQPVIVKKVMDGYMLVAGERRCRASKIAGFESVPAIVRDYNNQYLAELALLENIQREDLTIVEEANAYQNAISSLNLTHLELSQKIGKSRSYVSNTLGLLSLPQVVLDEINKGNISMGHARALSKLKDVSRIKSIASLIVDHQLTVREIEALAKKEKKKNQINRALPDNPLNELVNTAKLETMKVFQFEQPIKATKNKLVISFSNEEEIKKFNQVIKGFKENSDGHRD
ncbi:MAG: ParB/RepB/Spo0J family partition protein [Candidatus Izemoplasmatales bacterium]|jgi:ParB family chromosome partitioning protein|nr:ParB/RepB/Spo0J family partition protein [Candidatus Izemoplasmatales bacterium]